jgi:hypothetical protein
MAGTVISTTTNPNDGGLVGSTCVTDPFTGQKGLVLPQGGQLITYDGGARGTWSASASFILSAMPTDVLTIQGSASRTVRIKSIFLSGYASTAGSLVFLLIRRSSANSGGTASPSAPLLRDMNDAGSWTPTAVVSAYTANPASLGTSVGIGGRRRLFFNLNAAQLDRLSINFPDVGGKSFVLRGTSDFLCLNAAGMALPGATTVLDIDITADEDLS